MGAASSALPEASLRHIRDEYEENLRHKHEQGQFNDEEVLLHLRNFIMEKESAAVKELTNDFFNDHRDNNTICLGDVVKVRDDGLYFEAVVMSIDLENKTCVVSFGESHQEESAVQDFEDFLREEKQFSMSECLIVLHGHELEMEDHVEVRTDDDSGLYYAGHIIHINRRFIHDEHRVETTYDILLDQHSTQKYQMGDHEYYHAHFAKDHFDIAYGAKPENIRKIESNRMIARERWKRAWTKVRATLRFKGKGKMTDTNETNPPLPIQRADSISSEQKESKE